MAGDVAGCTAIDILVDGEHASYSSISSFALSKGPIAAADGVNGVVSYAGLSMHCEVGVDATETYREFDGHNTNYGRGLIYTEDS